MPVALESQKHVRQKELALNLYFFITNMYRPLLMPLPLLLLSWRAGVENVMWSAKHVSLERVGRNSIVIMLLLLFCPFVVLASISWIVFMDL